MLTISGLRRRGYTPLSIRNFCKTIGIGKSESRIDMGVLENEVRDDLNVTAPRRMCVLNPVKLIIDNYPEDLTEEVSAKNHPQDPEMGERTLPFSKEIYIERDDFMEDPPKNVITSYSIHYTKLYDFRCLGGGAGNDLSVGGHLLFDFVDVPAG